MESKGVEIITFLRGCGLLTVFPSVVFPCHDCKTGTNPVNPVSIVVRNEQLLLWCLTCEQEPDMC